MSGAMTRVTPAEPAKIVAAKKARHVVAPRNFLNFGSTHGTERNARNFRILIIHVLHPALELIFHVFFARNPSSMPLFTTPETDFGATLTTSQLCRVHVGSFYGRLTATFGTPAH